MRTINLWKTLVLSAAMLTMGGGMISCSDNNDDDKKFEGIPTITLYADKDAVDLTGGSINVVVTSDAPWTATVSESDVTLNKTKGNGDTNVTVTVPAHAERTIDVTFTATGYVNGIAIPKSAVLTIAQNEGGISLEGTISTIDGAGEYSLTDCWVVANTTQSFLMTDRSKAYMYVFVGTDGTVPAAGQVIDVNGTVELRNKYLQFSKPTIVEKDEIHAETLPTPEVLDYAGFFGITAGEFAYVTVTGTLVQSGTYTNITFTEGTNIGSVLYPKADLNVADFYNKVCDVTGFVTGMPNGINQLLVTEIKENSDVVVLSLDTASLAFDAAGGTKQVNYTTQNLGSNSVYTKIEGDADQFVAGTPADGAIAITANNNEGAAKSATLTVYIAASADAEPIVSKTVALSQAQAGAASLTFDCSAQGYTNAQDITEITIGEGITATFAGGTNTSNTPKYYDTGTGIRMYSGNTLTFNGNGATISKIEFICASGYNEIYAGATTVAGETILEDGIWTGSDETVAFHAIATKVRIQKIIVTYAK